MHRIDSENHENFISMQIQKDKSSRIFCKKLSKAFKKFFLTRKFFRDGDRSYKLFKYLLID